MADDSNLEIDGVFYDSKLSRSIVTLSAKYGYEKREVAVICSFFNSLMILEWHRVSDVYLGNCHRWKTKPIAVLNSAVSVFVHNINEDSN